MRDTTRTIGEGGVEVAPQTLMGRRSFYGASYRPAARP